LFYGKVLNAHIVLKKKLNLSLREFKAHIVLKHSNDNLRISQDFQLETYADLFKGSIEIFRLMSPVDEFGLAALRNTCYIVIPLPL